MQNRPTHHPDLFAHLEKHIGTIETGWKMQTVTPPVMIAKIVDRPMESTVTFATLGLSSRRLHQHGGGNDLRQELLFASADLDDDESIVALLMSIVADVIERNHALHSGQVLGPAGPILDGVKAEALFATSPVYFPDELQSYRGFDTPLIFAWLMPIMRSEAAFIAEHGPEAFETLLDEQYPNLLDPNRDALRLPRT
jgi:hypothetical protein